jgi:zinc ribbon protein
MEFVVIAFFFGLAAGVVGKIKGSSFLLWFLIGAVLPILGLGAALLYRFDRNEPRRACPECGNDLPLYAQVCPRCGKDLEFPDVDSGVRRASGAA